MEAIARSRFARYAPRKVNQVLSLIRNKPVEKAFEILSFTPKNSAVLIHKTLKSAVANAGRIRNMGGLKIKQCWVGKGQYLKRMRTGPMGRGMMYTRKTSHLSIVVCDMTQAEIEKYKSKNKRKGQETKQ